MKLKQAIELLENAITQDAEGTNGYYEALGLVIKKAKVNSSDGWNLLQGGYSPIAALDGKIKPPQGGSGVTVTRNDKSEEEFKWEFNCRILISDKDSGVDEIRINYNDREPLLYMLKEYLGIKDCYAKEDQHPTIKIKARKGKIVIERI